MSTKKKRKVEKKAKTYARETFRHGNLRQALLEAGVRLAQAGGPQAVVLREATRRAGVAPNAAYRHFADRNDLLQAVRATALSTLAFAIEAEMEQLPPNKPPADHARALLRAVGKGYLKFALEQTGLFRTAFSVSASVEGDLDVAKTGHTGLNPFQLLGSALDRMVEANILSAERRTGAEYMAWSAVHGFAFLVIEGPLNSAPATSLQALTERLLEMVEKGL